MKMAYDIIRDGGKLRHSKFNFDKKHYILLPLHHPVLFRSECLNLPLAGTKYLWSVNDIDPLQVK